MTRGPAPRWCRITVAEARSQFGWNAASAWQHYTGHFWLVHVLPRDPASQGHKTIGWWAVYEGDREIDRRSHYGVKWRRPPKTWANNVIRLHEEGGESGA